MSSHRPVRTAKSVPRWATTLLVVLAMAACTSLTKPVARKDLLDFFADGHTSCADVIVHLGDPSQQYEDGRLLTYKIARDSASRYHVVVAPDWSDVNYSLVVKCSSDGEVLAHALVPVKGGS